MKPLSQLRNDKGRIYCGLLICDGSLAVTAVCVSPPLTAAKIATMAATVRADASTISRFVRWMRAFTDVGDVEFMRVTWAKPYSVARVPNAAATDTHIMVNA